MAAIIIKYLMKQTGHQLLKIGVHIAVTENFMAGIDLWERQETDYQLPVQVRQGTIIGVDLTTKDGYQVEGCQLNTKVFQFITTFFSHIIHVTVGEMVMIFLVLQ